MSKEKKSNNQEILKHSTAHVLAAAVLEMFPDAKFGTGPSTEEGFYYDFMLPRTLIPEDLEILEEKMSTIIKANHPFEKEEISIESAIEHFKKANQPYKIEIIKDIKRESQASNLKPQISLYKTGNFVDLCSGPHIDSTREINFKAFKLTKISGAYWRADETRDQMQRIYGVVFSDKKELKEYLNNIEEAKKRDHKKIGQELDLFSFHPEAPGSAFWHPKGMILWNELEQFGKNLRKKYGNLEIQTPQLAKNILWKTSGHWDHYKEDMFHFDVDKETYCLKPMDCPFNVKIYQTKQRSYKDLPIRYTEIGRVLRNEKSGQLNGLLRVRTITQDDAHIFLTHSQVENEISTLLRMVKEYYAVFGIKPAFFLSTRPETFLGEIKDWDKAESDLQNALKKEKIEFEIKEKDGAFYGPKIDVDIKDALGRKWQVATIQLDFQLPGRFKLEYVSEDGSRKEPVIIHAAIFGSFERFIGILTEHFAGEFPVWLSPVQVSIVPVSEKFNDYGEKIREELSKLGVRAELNNRDESLGKRIREEEKQKVPYVLVVGEKEADDKTVAVRKRGEKNKQDVVKFEEFRDAVVGEIKERK